MLHENMKTVSLLSQKGGTGKTTLCVHLAVAAERAGKSAVILDLDPQASSTGWKDNRAGETPIAVSLQYTRLRQTLTASSQSGADFAFIDSAPHSDSVAMAAAEAADLILIPCRAGILDLRAIAMTARIAKLAGKPAFVILNALPPQAAGLIAEAAEAVAVHGLELAPVAIRQRAAFAHSLIDGRVAMEFDPKGKAAAEMTELYQWLAKELTT
jgi:chromosome partitioning protein